MMVDSGASEWAATRLLDGPKCRRPLPKTLARPGLTPSRATRDKAMPAGPGRRRLSRVESRAGESAAAVTRLLDKARADSDDLLLSVFDSTSERTLPPTLGRGSPLPAIATRVFPVESRAACHLSPPPVSECSILGPTAACNDSSSCGDPSD